jgi:hypothetical protein
MNPRLKLSTLEKINHFIKLQEALTSKLEMLRSKKIVVHNTGLGGSSKRGRPAGNKGGQMMTLVSSNINPNEIGMIYNQKESGIMENDSDVDEDMESKAEISSKVKSTSKQIGLNRVEGVPRSNSKK